MSGDTVDRSTAASFVRGGTSKGLVFHARDLPADRSEWTAIFLSAMGSPDPYGRQLNGMGGGLSSLSKVCVVAPSDRAGIDVEYTFAQVQVGEPHVNYSGNCGNMSSAIGPIAVDDGIVTAPDGSASIRMLNLNTGKIIVAHFAVAGGRSVVEPWAEMDGVAGPSTKVTLDFLDPGGAATGSLLPTGSPRDILTLEDGSRVEVSLVDAANPCVFVMAGDIGCSGIERPEALDASPGVLERLQRIRRAASVAMGISESTVEAAKNPTTPFIALVSAPTKFAALDGREYAKTEMSLSARFISNGHPHRAIPGTGAICVAAAAQIPGTVVEELATTMNHTGQSSRIRIGHPSGCTEAAAVAEFGAHGLAITSGSLFRTTRRLFDGRVHHAGG